MNKKLDFDKNVLEYECYLCRQIPEYIAEFYDNENDEILYVCEKCKESEGK